MRRALVVEDDVMTAAFVHDLLAAAGFEVQVAHTANAASAALETYDPDIAILDISLGRGPTGLDLAYLAAQSSPGVALLLLTRYPDLRVAGVNPADLPPNCGFLCKADVANTSMLLEAVEALLDETQFHQHVPRSAQGPLSNLTRTQLEVLHMVAQGYSTGEIARRRQRSSSAVDKIMVTIYQRLGIEVTGEVNPRVEAARIYAAHAVLPDRPEPTLPPDR